MGRDVGAPRSTPLAKFEPRKAKKREAAWGAIRATAQRIKDWDMLKRAVDEQISEQRKFVKWWDGAVRPQGNQSNNASRRYLDVHQAQDQFAISQQQVSRWRTRFEDEDAYRRLLYGKSYRTAMSSPL